MQMVHSGFELRAAADAESVPLVRDRRPRVYLERFDLGDDRIAEVTLAVAEACPAT